MKTSKIKSVYTLVFLIGIALVSCQKFVEIAPPVTQPEQHLIFNDDQSATSATLGMYQQMTSTNLSFTNGGITIYLALLADELENNNTNINYDAFRTNTLTSDNSIVNQTLWANPYKNIYQANAVIEGLVNSNHLSPALKRQLMGEALYIRALHYFYLVNLFGDVPLITTTNYEKNSLSPRVNTAAIYLQVSTDLELARTLLPEQTNLANTRPSYASATALLARVYLYQQNWAAAATMATAVINNNRYNLESVANVFLATSKETLFGLVKQAANTSEGATFVPSSATVKPTFSLNTNLVNAFEQNDSRKLNWVKANLVSSVSYDYPNKYKIRSNAVVTENYVVQRLAEVYLIRAEARLMLKQLPEAITDIDLIRSRAGLAKIAAINPTINETAVFDALAKEYQLEFFAEWGHRWLNLKRWGQADVLLKALKGENWQSTDQLLPIPLEQLQRNPLLKQNIGY